MKMSNDAFTRAWVGKVCLDGRTEVCLVNGRGNRWNDGVVLYSYKTVVACFAGWRVGADLVRRPTWYVNSLRYSRTTTCFTNGLKREVARVGGVVIECPCEPHL